MLWVLLLFTIGERFSFILGSQDRAWPFTIFYEGDAERFYDYAQAILASRTYDSGIPFHPPLFPLVLAALHGLLGPPAPNLLLRLLLAVASAGVPALLYLIIRDAVGRGPAIAAGFLAAFSFGLDVIGSSATSEGLYLLLILASIYIVRIPPTDVRRTLPRAAILGAIGGLAALTRAEGLLASLFIAGAWLGEDLRNRVKRGGALRSAGLWLAGAAVVILPWTIRNAVTLSKWNDGPGRALGTHLPTFVPITAYGPLNFALANCDSASGGFQRALLTARSDVAVLDLSDAQHRRYFLNGTSEGARWIAGHPLGFTRLVGRKLDITSRAFDLGWSPWNLPLGRTGIRRPVDVFSPEVTGLRWLQILLAIAGGWILLREGKRRALLLLAAPIASCLLAAVLFFGYVRLGVLILPFLFSFEGVALAGAASRLPGRIRHAFGRRDLRWVLAILAAFILLLGAMQSRNYQASGKTARPGGTLNPDAEMRITPIE